MKANGRLYVPTPALAPGATEGAIAVVRETVSSLSPAPILPIPKCTSLPPARLPDPPDPASVVVACKRVDGRSGQLFAHHGEAQGLTTHPVSVCSVSLW